MSVADKDGRISQSLNDRLVTLGMEMAESMRQASRAFRDIFPELSDDDE